MSSSETTVTLNSIFRKWRDILGGEKKEEREKESTVKICCDLITKKGHKKVGVPQTMGTPWKTIFSPSDAF